ncbi:hypothetical protein CAI21_16170 [Alkalilimnicola ehrlichii]|uniref:histidine kinase n=1 Tax=Alkalilimnicola ehrlichii TaxID=351052 RepID=A0A3E0WLS5_9GAMM|nr:PAS domain-containing protein [Alkalilimnicola ehrlichii]RFA26816.1 hypothetical protein CAI21_16170 [Alkalilimnicola ehrlichii]RFA33910.1 hypothetical protein CAL65_16295 [Alkalilimnicola ehrlichii]
MDSDQRLRLISRATNDIIWDWDIETGWLAWNDAVASQLGYTPEEMGHSLGAWEALIHPDDRKRVVDSLHMAVEKGEDGWHEEYRLRKRDGSYATFMDRGYIARDQSGKSCRMIGSLLDVTERRGIEEALRASEARFRQMADAVPQIIWIADPKGNIEFFNRQWFTYTGQDDKATTVEEAAYKVVHPADVERVLTGLKESHYSGETFVSEMRLRAKNGDYRWFLVRAVPYCEADSGRIIRWFGVSVDIHDRKLAEEALQEADRHKDEFLAMLAHELRSPLAAIRNTVHLLEKRPEAPEAARYLGIVKRQTRRLSALVDDLLDVSRVTRGLVTLRTEPVNLSDIVDRALESVQSLVDEKRHRVRVARPSVPVWVEGDAIRLEQILVNLLANAAKYTDAGGNIDLRLTTEGDNAELRVLDNGIGMKPEVLRHVFDLFGQAERGLDRAKGGLGIGLTIVKNLVELHGGTIAVHSAGPHRGSEFIVRFPLAAGQPSRAEQQMVVERSQHRGLGGVRVLVVDDSSEIAETLALLLEDAGHEVMVANDGTDALRLAAQAKPNVVLLDIGLPGMDGYEVARRMRREPATKNALMAALTGYGQASDRDKALAAGFDRHFVKPVDIDTLEAFVNSAATQASP